MQEMNLFAALALSVVIFGCGHQPLMHDSRLAERYPYGLIGSDFGILGSSDLAVNACQAKPVPFSTKEASSYQYWQCFQTKDAQASCEESDKRHAIFGVDIETANAKHHYVGPRVDTASNCRWLLMEWNRVTADQRYVCLSGQFEEMDSKNSAGREETSWIVDRFKTTVGCVSQFYGGCDLAYQLKNGCSSGCRPL